jgi:hypothetical protein
MAVAETMPPMAAMIFAGLVRLPDDSVAHDGHDAEEEIGPGKGHGVAEGGAPAAVIGIGADHFGAHGLVMVSSWALSAWRRASSKSKKSFHMESSERFQIEICSSQNPVDRKRLTSIRSETASHVHRPHHNFHSFHGLSKLKMFAYLICQPFNSRLQGSLMHDRNQFVCHAP